MINIRFDQSGHKFILFAKARRIDLQKDCLIHMTDPNPDEDLIFWLT